MKSARWVIQETGGLLLETNDGETLYPSAKDIFSVQFKSLRSIGDFAVIRPSDDLPDLKFSKIPLVPKVKIGYMEDMGSQIIEAKIVLNNKNKDVTLNTSSDFLLDNLIIESTWYPIEQGSMEEISGEFNKAGISSAGRISLKEYLALRKSSFHLIQDELSTTRINRDKIVVNDDVKIPLFEGNLYPYQMQGYLWLKMISDEGAGCILADEMGLGKTAQIIALLAYEKSVGRTTSLVIAPVTLMENWKREVSKFAPELRVIIHQGFVRTGFYQELRKYDLVLTTYETVLRDLSMMQMIEWNLVVLDEAQAIKNPNAKRTEAVKQIPKRAAIAVTGTPIENRLMDLWSITDFAFPGFLGELNQFEKQYTDNIEGASSLEPVISPIMLRRRVSEVAKDLPERINIPQVMEMDSREAELYETLRQEIIEEYGKSASLISLIKLRMFCTHPLLQIKEKDNPTRFLKYLRMTEIIEEIVANNEKVLIFTSFTEMTDIMVHDLSDRFNIQCDYIDGRVPVLERQPKIDIFSKCNKSAILVLNPRAAGAGLNITAANHVIHYNLEWNPAIEDQASARAYRRGQTRPVNIYRLYYANTVEEAINDRLERKRMISETAIVGTDGSSNDYADILGALSMTPTRGN